MKYLTIEKYRIRLQITIKLKFVFQAFTRKKVVSLSISTLVRYYIETVYLAGHKQYIKMGFKNNAAVKASQDTIEKLYNNNIVPQMPFTLIHYTIFFRYPNTNT